MVENRYDLQGAIISQSVIGHGTVTNIDYGNQSSSISPSEYENILKELTALKDQLKKDTPARRNIEALEACAKKGAWNQVKKLAAEFALQSSAGSFATVLGTYLAGKLL